MSPRRIFVGWFSLVVLYTALTQSQKVAGLLGLTTAATRRLSDPTVPLIGNKAAADLATAGSIRDNSAAGIYGPIGGQYIGGTFVPFVPPQTKRPTQAKAK